MTTPSTDRTSAHPTGLVPRWRAWLYGVAGLVAGQGIARFGFADTIGLAVMAFVAAVVGLGVVLELRGQARQRDEFDRTHHDMDVALQERGGRC